MDWVNLVLSGGSWLTQFGQCGAKVRDWVNLVLSGGSWLTQFG